MRIEFEYRDGGEPEDVADEVERVAEMLRDGYVEGELFNGNGRGWWRLDFD